MALKLTMLSPERKLLSDIPVQSVTVPGSEGQIEILDGHATFYGLLETGPFRYLAEDGSEESGVISSGFCRVEGENVTLLAETLEFSREIELGRARDAQKKAEEQLREASLDEKSFKKYERKLQRALVRQQMAK